MKKHKCQNNETQIVLDYFKGFKGTVLEIGANDGITFSNSYDLILSGWKAVLVEPSSQCDKIVKLWDNPAFDVKIFQVGIGAKHERKVLYESGAHVKNGKDRALVSTTIIEETERWKTAGVLFAETTIDIARFDWLIKVCKNTSFDYISIDVEGMEFEILEQINLSKVGCKCLCIEWNGNADLKIQFSQYCRNYGMRLIHENAENLIFVI